MGTRETHERVESLFQMLDIRYCTSYYQPSHWMTQEAEFKIAIVLSWQYIFYLICQSFSSNYDRALSHALVAGTNNNLDSIDNL
jgi:hypothetical protein